jgi:hypothetical protein
VGMSRYKMKESGAGEAGPAVRGKSAPRFAIRGGYESDWLLTELPI